MLIEKALFSHRYEVNINVSPSYIKSHEFGRVPPSFRLVLYVESHQSRPGKETSSPPSTFSPFGMKQSPHSLLYLEVERAQGHVLSGLDHLAFRIEYPPTYLLRTERQWRTERQ